MMNMKWLNVLKTRGLRTDKCLGRNETKRLALERTRNRFSLILKREGKYVSSSYFLMALYSLTQSGHLLRMAKLKSKGCIETSNPSFQGECARGLDKEKTEV